MSRTKDLIPDTHLILSFLGAAEAHHFEAVAFFWHLRRLSPASRLHLPAPLLWEIASRGDDNGVPPSPLLRLEALGLPAQIVPVDQGLFERTWREASPAARWTDLLTLALAADLHLPLVSWDESLASDAAAHGARVVTPDAFLEEVEGRAAGPQRLE